LGFGPRRLEPNGTAIDNDGTWLGETDLVFVDPVGTGYSRPTRAEYGPEFYQTRGDAESVAEFIRLYRTRFDAADAPLFLAGESYGVTRAAGVAEVLQRRGIPLRGVVLIGLALPLGQSTPELRAALMVPTYTAAALHSRKLAPDLQGDLEGALRKAEEWAKAEYAPALARRDSLTPAQRDAVAAQLARFTGLDAGVVDRRTLTVPYAQFAQQLLRREGRVVGHYDSRMTGPIDTTQQMYDPTRDPSLKSIISDVGVVRYLRNTLRFESDLPYQGPFGGGYPPPTAFRGDWMSTRWNRGALVAGTPAGAGGAGGSGGGGGGGGRTAPAADAQPLRTAMRANPALRVLSMCGWYDLVCSAAGNASLGGALEPELRGRVTVRSYLGGHAIYTDRQARLDIRRDVAAFMREAVAAPRE
jgi:carboxypeptidase C (cathepsin A)